MIDYTTSRAYDALLDVVDVAIRSTGWQWMSWENHIAPTEAWQAALAVYELTHNELHATVLVYDRGTAEALALTPTQEAPVDPDVNPPHDRSLDPILAPLAKTLRASGWFAGSYFSDSAPSAGWNAAYFNWEADNRDAVHAGQEADRVDAAVLLFHQSVAERLTLPPLKHPAE